MGGQSFIHMRSAPDKPEEQEWAANFLKKALVYYSAEAGGELQKFIHHTGTKESVSWSVEFDKGLVTKAQKLWVQCDTVFLEVYQSTLPRGESFVRWGLTRAVCFLRGDLHDGRWLAKTALAFRKFLKEMPVASATLLDSRKSVMDSCVFHNKELTRELWSSADPGWSVSTAGFILMCCYFVTSGKVGGTAQKDIDKKASQLLQAWFEKYMDDGSALAIEAPGEACGSGNIILQRGEFSVPAGGGSNMCKAFVRGSIKSVELLVHLVRVLRRRSQHSQSKVQVAVASSHTVDYGFMRGKYGEEAHVLMPELYRDGSSRPRHVSKTFKLSISEVAYDQPSLRNAQQLLAARRVFLNGSSKADEKSQRGVKPGAGRTFCQDNMLCYIASTQLELKDCPHGYVGMDGTRVSSKDIIFYVFEGLPAKRSCWLVPKVLPVAPEPTLGCFDRFQNR